MFYFYVPNRFPVELYNTDAQWLLHVSQRL